MPSTLPSLADLFAVVCLVVWVLARQLRTAPVKHRLLVLVPLVLCWAGLRDLPSAGLDGVETGLVAVSAAGSVALGLWRGRSLQVWQDAAGTWWRRGTPTTLALWLAVLALRGAVAAVGAVTGHPHGSAASVMLCCLALSLAAQNAVTLLRARTPLGRPLPHPPQPAPSPGTTAPAAAPTPFPVPTHR